MTGLVGLLVCFLWFLTDHQATALNMNFLWAFPLNIVFAIGVIRNGKIADWIPKYVMILLGLLVLMILLWLFRFQQFSPLLIVLLITLGIRYTFLLYHYKKMKGSGS
jgi:predicted membrane metal-binding protein